MTPNSVKTKRYASRHKDGCGRYRGPLRKPTGAILP
jgi:hypothetical protein